MFSSSFIFIFNILFYFGVPVLLILGFLNTKNKLKEVNDDEDERV